MSLESDIEQALSRGMMKHQQELISQSIDQLRECLEVIKELRQSNEKYRALVEEQSNIIDDLIKSKEYWKSEAYRTIAKTVKYDGLFNGPANYDECRDWRMPGHKADGCDCAS